MRRSTIVPLLLFAVALMLLVGCGADDQGSRPPTTTVLTETPASTETGEVPTVEEDEDEGDDEGEAGENGEKGHEKEDAKGKSKGNGKKD
jgi:hypothetical protein